MALSKILAYRAIYTLLINQLTSTLLTITISLRVINNKIIIIKTFNLIKSLNLIKIKIKIKIIKIKIKIKSILLKIVIALIILILILL